MKTEGSMTTTAAPGENEGKKPAISAEQVRKLRERAGAPMMDCKKALEACNGEEEAAIDWLRKKGISTAAKKSARVTSEGSVASYIHAGGKIGVLVEINCESRDWSGHLTATEPVGSLPAGLPGPRKATQDALGEALMMY